jgi:hypothetical protein
VIRRARQTSDELCESALSDRIEEVLTDVSGIKHVYDPSGYPFQEPWQRPSCEDMDRDAALWHRLNAALLNHPGMRVIFLRRRDSFLRYVSDCVAHQSGHWGFFDNKVTVGESARYRKTLSNISLPPLDETLVGWYTENVPRIFQTLREAVTNPVMDVWYEDYFGQDVTLPERLAKFSKVVEFLQIGAPADFYQSADLELLLKPSAKLNDDSIFERIPNFRHLRQRFGIPAPALAPTVVSQIVSPAPRKKPGGADLVEPKAWRFRAAAGNVAGLVFPPDRPGTVRVDIPKATTPATFDVMLTLPDVRLNRGEQYELQFRARSDRQRMIGVCVTRGCEPYDSLGLHADPVLTPEWRDVCCRFAATADDEQAGLHFQLGGSAVGVELAFVSLRERSGKASELDAVPSFRQLVQDLAAMRQQESRLETEIARLEVALDEAGAASDQLKMVAKDQEQTLAAARQRLWTRIGLALGLLDRRDFEVSSPGERFAEPNSDSGKTDPAPEEFTNPLPSGFPWRLRTSQGNEAETLLIPGRDNAFRVAIRRTIGENRWDVQLQRGGLRLSRHHRYRLSFRARSESPRLIGAGLSDDGAPWSNAGFYEEFRLRTDWRSFRSEFVCGDTEFPLRLHLDLGTRRSDLYISDLQLDDLDDPFWSMAPKYKKASASCGPDASESQVPPEVQDMGRQA